MCKDSVYTIVTRPISIWMVPKMYSGKRLMRNVMIIRTEHMALNIAFHSTPLGLDFDSHFR